MSTAFRPKMMAKQEWVTLVLKQYFRKCAVHNNEIGSNGWVWQSLSTIWLNIP
jgi:hypothetical protein